MILVGLTGGSGSGKSHLARALRRLGAYWIDADELARRAVSAGGPGLEKIARIFGAQILNSDGTLNRAKLGRRIFADPDDRKRLNAIVHPLVFSELQRQVEDIGRKDPDAVVLFDAPLLIETGYHKRMDRVILVRTDRKTQIERLMKRDGLTRREALLRIRSQFSTARKAREADFVVPGTGSAAQVEKRARRIYEALRRLASVRSSKNRSPVPD